VKNKSTPGIRFAEFTVDWEQRKLGELCDEFKSGKNIKSEDIRDDGKYPVFGGNGLRGYTNTYNHDGLYALIGRQGALCGNMNISYGKTYFTEHAVAIKGNKNNETRFLFYLLGKMNLGQYSGQSAQPGLAVNKLIELSAFIPTFAEQAQISALFKNLDILIALHQQELTTLKQTKQGFMKKMFPKEGESVPEVRSPGFTGDWEQRKLGEIMDVTSVKRIHQSDWMDKGVRFLRARDIVAASKNKEPSDYLYISVDKYNEYSKVSGKVSQGDLLVTGVGTIGVPMLVTDDEPIYFKDGNIIWFKNEHRIEGNFFYYSFKNNNIQKYIRDVAGIGTVGTYTIDSGKKTPISLPSFEEQTKIGNFFKQLDGTIDLHQRELDTLKETKNAFLQKMFA
jgi:type I restriction enzyme S subunit